ncbi:conjugal transfer protein TraD, partial [Ochrobactrum quorumnocens]
MATNRKKVAREKFLLGSIVIRAGLSNVDRAFLLGGLLELAR